MVDKLLAETGAGVHTPEVEDVKQALRKMYREYQQSGKVAYQGEVSEIDNYSHREMARKFAAVLAQVTRESVTI